VQAVVACSAAIEDGPERRCNKREDEQAEHEDEVVGFVAAAAPSEDKRSFVVEDVGCGEGDDLAPGWDAGGIGEIVFGVGEE
jgi:hypothetical protein